MNVALNLTFVIIHFSDPESDVKSVSACMGQTSRDCYLVAWIPLEGDPKTMVFDVEIPGGILAWPKIKVCNNGKCVMV